MNCCSASGTKPEDNNLGQTRSQYSGLHQSRVYSDLSELTGRHFHLLFFIQPTSKALLSGKSVKTSDEVQLHLSTSLDTCSQCSAAGMICLFHLGQPIDGCWYIHQ